MAKGAKCTARKPKPDEAKWSRRAVIQQADIHATQIEHSMLVHLRSSPIEIAAVGAQLIARGMHREHVPCTDPDCSGCRDMETLSGEVFRKTAHEMLDFFLQRAALALNDAQGSC